MKKQFQLKLWLLAVRPRTLLISVAPMLLSQFLAWQALNHSQGETLQASVPGFSWLLALLCLSCALLLQISVNLANDYFDHRSGVDDDHRLGPVRVTQQGLLKPEQVKLGFIVSLVLGVSAGLAVMALSSALLFWLGLLCVFGVLTYTSGPFPLAYNALGELVVFLVFGPVAVMGGYYAQCQELLVLLWLPACAMGLLAAAIMLTNNVRDDSSDRKAGKRTIVFFLGMGASRGLYLTMVGLAAISALVFAVMGYGAAWFSLLIVPWAIWLCRNFLVRSGAELNDQLAQTAQFMLVVAVLLMLDVQFIG